MQYAFVFCWGRGFETHTWIDESICRAIEVQFLSYCLLFEDPTIAIYLLSFLL